MSRTDGFLGALIDAIFGSDDLIGGQAVAKLQTALPATETGSLEVETTFRFGEYQDGDSDALLLINGEVIYADSRNLTQFGPLLRGALDTEPTDHPAGSLVYDFSKNRTAIDLARRGFFVNTARDSDLDVVGRNLGLHKCNGLTEAQWRDLIKVMAFLPNQPVDSIKQVLDVYPGVGNYTLVENLINEPLTIIVRVPSGLTTGVRGKFFLNGGTACVANGAGTQVSTPYAIAQVLGVYDGTDYRVLHGEREGLTNYATTNNFVGSTITLDAPVAPNAPVIVDYGAFTAHYLPTDETIRYPLDGDYFPYLSDPSAILSCLLDQVRAAGVRVRVETA